MKTQETMINVIFDAAKGDLVTRSREAVEGKPLGTLPRPTRSGYTFEGWYHGDILVTEETLAGGEDLRLTAHWSRKKGAKKPSMLKKQRLAAIILSLVGVALIVTLIVVNYVVAIFGLTDVYYDENGNKLTEKYTVKRQNGSYALFDKDGNRMEANEKGYFIAHSGNQYIIDPETGEYEVYALVDYDAAGGESTNAGLVMMFPEISQKNIFSIKVENEYGTYTFLRDSKTSSFYIEGVENIRAAYDPELFVSLCVSCGYTTAWKKLDFTSGRSDIPLTPDGKVDYSAYGLVDEYDAEGNLIYSPAVYTITKAVYAADGSCAPATETVNGETRTVQYTVKVGRPILSDAGIYVQLVGRDTVYIVDDMIRDTVLQPIEALIRPQIISAMTTISHVMVKDFLLGTTDFSDYLNQITDDSALQLLKDGNIDPAKLEALTQKLTIDPIASFSYQETENRTNTLLSASPYVGEMGLLEGYELNDENISEVLSLIYNLQSIACRQLVLTKEALVEYGLDKDVYWLSFNAPVTDSNSNITGYTPNTLIISQKTENNTYYIASFAYGIIVEVEEHHLSFLDWAQKDWYNTRLITQNIAYLKELSVQIGDKKYDFSFDNSKSDLSNDINTRALKVFCEQYFNGIEETHLLDYSKVYTYINNSGKEKTVTYTGLDNFREFFETLIWFSLEGDFDEDEERKFEKNLGMSVTDYIAQGESACDAMITLKAEDYAKTMNKVTYKDENGDEVKLYPENNKISYVLRFYKYTEGRALLTLEVLENESSTPDPTKAQYAFYVFSDYFNEIAQDGDDLLAGNPIDPKTNQSL